MLNWNKVCFVMKNACKQDKIMNGTLEIPLRYQLDSKEHPDNILKVNNQSSQNQNRSWTHAVGARIE